MPRRPNNTDPHSLADRFRSAAAAEDWPSAVGALDALLDLMPTNASLHYNRAVALRRMGEPLVALAAADAAIRLDSTHQNARFERAAALMDAGETAAAADAFDRYLSRVPTDEDARLNLALCRLRLGEPASALNVLANLSDPRIDLARAEALRDLGRHKEAQAILAQCPKPEALKVRTHGASGTLPLDPARLWREN